MRLRTVARMSEATSGSTGFGHQAEIGYSTRDGLSPYIRADVEQEAVRIF